MNSKNIPHSLKIFYKNKVKKLMCFKKFQKFKKMPTNCKLASFECTNKKISEINQTIYLN